MLIWKIISMLFISLIGFFFLMPMQSHSEEYDYPAWVPIDAIEAAENNLDRFVWFYTETTSSSSYPKTINELASCQIRYVYEVVNVDYAKVEEGGDVREQFSYLKSSNVAYGFGVFLGEAEIGSLVMTKVDGIWREVHTTINSIYSVPHLKRIFETHPSGEGNKIYKENTGTTYFIEKDNQIISIVGINNGEFFETNPRAFIMKTKERIDRLNSAYKKQPQLPIPSKKMNN